MRRVLSWLVLWLGCSVPVEAQPIGLNQTVTVIDSGAACSVAGACATFALDSTTSAVTLSVSGTWTGTLTFEGTNNDGIWTALFMTNAATAAKSTTTTANGLFGVGNAGFLKIRARATAAMTGSALVTAARGSGNVAENSADLGGLNTFAGLQTFTVNGIATTPTSAVVITNTTASTGGVTVQMSPRLGWCGNVWNTSANETSCFFAENLPATAVTPTAQFKLGYSRNGGAVTYPWTLNNTGSITATGSLTLGTGFNVGFTGRGFFTAVADGLWSLNNNAATLGAALKVDALPTVASGFGTSPAVTAGSTPLAGSINVGTGGIATTGVITFGGTAYPSAPFCLAGPAASNTLTRASATSTTQLTLSTTVAWGASDVVSWLCVSSR